MIAKVKMIFSNINWDLVLNDFVIFLILVLFYLFSPALFFAVLGLYLFVFVVYLLKCKAGNKRLKRIMQDYSNIVFGFKGAGKDLLMQIGIKEIYYKQWKKDKSQKDLYFSNVNYGYGGTVKDLSFMTLPFTYNDFLEGNATVIEKDLSLEGKNYYHSDTGVALPNFLDNLLTKKHHGMPLVFALTRHLWDMNITINSQDLNRVWKKLREQQDYYILANNTFPKKRLIKVMDRLPLYRKYLFVSWTSYDRYESAQRRLLPFRARDLIGSSFKDLKLSQAQATKKVFESENGEIVKSMACIKRKHIKYDTRHFHNIVFGYKIGGEI